MVSHRMTLRSVAEYDSTAVPTFDSHAVVIGGSMAGLLAARVLADGYERVTLLERDPMPERSVARRGTPQASHVHAMLEPARVILNELFPGYSRELCSAGGVVIDAATQLSYYEQGDYLEQAEGELPMPCASRPLFEQVVRRRIFDSEHVTVRPECHVTDYLTDDTATTVEGVAFRDEDGGDATLQADLVVDATGRTSRTHQWLADHGYPTPQTDEVEVDLAYGTVTVERPPDDTSVYLVVPSAPDTAGGTAVPIEDDQWLVTLFGMHGDHPPTDRERYIEFADRLADSVLANLLRTHEWVSDTIDMYPFPSSLWRHYEELDHFPDGLVVTGDAIASFNPIYGQGMSAASLDALQLHHCLRQGADGLGPRFFDRATEHLDVIWQTAVGADFEFDETTGPKPFGTDLFNMYVSRLIDTAQEDSRVAEEFYRVLRLEQPPTTLFRPGIAGRVLLG